MTRGNTFIARVAFFLLFYLICSRPAHAYIDPATGSMVLQVVIAATLGAALAIKIFARRIVTLAKRLFSKGPSSSSDNDDN